MRPEEEAPPQGAGENGTLMDLVGANKLLFVYNRVLGSMRLGCLMSV